MKMTLKINGKLLLFILGTTALIYVVALGYVAIKLNNLSNTNAKQAITNESRAFVNKTSVYFNQYIIQANSIARLFSGVDEIEPQNRDKYFISQLNNIINQQNGIYSAWVSVNYNSIDELTAEEINWDFNHAIALNNNTPQQFDIEQVLTAHQGEIDLATQTTEVIICEPQTVNYNKTDENTIAIIAPVFVNDNIIGVVGFDISINYAKNYILNNMLFADGGFFILSNNGKIVASTDSINAGAFFVDYASEIEKAGQVIDKTKNKIQHVFNAQNPRTLEKSIYSIEPLIFGQNNPWSVILYVPKATFMSESRKAFINIIIIGLAGIVILLIFITTISKSISRPLKRNTKALQLLAEGKINDVEKLKFRVEDEINEIGQSINHLVNGLKRAALFANQIGAGNLDEKYELLSDKDSLGNSLINMRTSLIKAKNEADKKKVEDEKRNWVTHGLAKFGEIIRQDNNDMEKFSVNVINNLVEYMDAAQAAIYINEKNEYDEFSQDIFHLKAAMAYGKLIMVTKSVEIGKELIGFVASDNQLVNLTNIPENYASLSPGMKNQKKPNNLLVAPISINEQALGVFEILSYKPFEPHHVEFIEKLCENIASVIASVKVNVRTKKLLEQSQFQADELSQHEEEMRQNLEELTATQEEAQKRYSSLASLIKAIKGTIPSAELDIKGRIIDVSPAMTVLFGASRESMIGNFYDAFNVQNETERVEFSTFWEKMLRSGDGNRMQLIKQRKKEYWLNENYLVIRKDDLPPKVLLVIEDKSRLNELNERLKAEINQQ